jgi:TPR repeat protein
MAEKMGNFEKGVEAYENGNYAAAREEFHPLADAGYAKAQYYLGRIYHKGGGGMAQDDVEAVGWYRLAAEQGHAQAQSNLAEMMLDHTEALRLYRFAAEQGDAKAQFNLGVLYAESEGVARNYKKAAEWFTLAAEQGYAKAQLNLGVLYHNGEGVPQDFAKAYMWANLAAAQGNKNAVKFRNELNKSLTPEQVAEAQRLSRQFFDANH